MENTLGAAAWVSAECGRGEGTWLPIPRPAPAPGSDAPPAFFPNSVPTAAKGSDPTLPRVARSRAALQDQNHPHGPAQAAGPLNFSILPGPVLPQGGVTTTTTPFLTRPCNPHPAASLRGGGSTQNFSRNRETSLPAGSSSSRVLYRHGRCLEKPQAKLCPAGSHAGK